MVLRLYLNKCARVVILSETGLLILGLILCVVLLIISEKGNLDKIRNTVKETWENLNVRANIMTLPVEKHGAQIISE